MTRLMRTSRVPSHWSEQEFNYFSQKPIKIKILCIYFSIFRPSFLRLNNFWFILKKSHLYLHPFFIYSLGNVASQGNS